MEQSHIKCGARFENLRFLRLGAHATVLTILDVCGNPYALTCMSERVALSKEALKAFKKNTAFDNVPVPVACLKSSVTWCCRVGWSGQCDAGPAHPEYKPREFSGDMSCLICFQVMNCVLAAVKARKYNDDETRDLDLVFEEKFQDIRPRYLHDNPNKPMPRTHLDLRGLQLLVDGGVLPINESAFDCILYKREWEWFPTRELTLTYHPYHDADRAMGDRIVDFIIQSILQWHRADPDKRYWDQVLAPGYGDKGYADYEYFRAWHALLKAVSEFRPGLIYAFVGIDEYNQVSLCADEGDSNADLKDLALCYPGLPKIVTTVERWIATGIEGDIADIERWIEEKLSDGDDAQSLSDIA